MQQHSKGDFFRVLLFVDLLYYFCFATAVAAAAAAEMFDIILRSMHFSICLLCFEICAIAVSKTPPCCTIISFCQCQHRLIEKETITITSAAPAATTIEKQNMIVFARLLFMQKQPTNTHIAPVRAHTHTEIEQICKQSVKSIQQTFSRAVEKNELQNKTSYSLWMHCRFQRSIAS